MNKNIVSQFKFSKRLKVKKHREKYLIVAILILLIILTTCGDPYNNSNSLDSTLSITKEATAYGLITIPTQTFELDPLSKDLLQPIYSQNLGEINNVSMSKDFEIVIGSSESEVVIFDSIGTSASRNIVSRNPSYIEISAEKQKIAWVSENRIVTLAELDRKENLPVILNNDTPVTGLAFSPSGDQLAYSTYSSELILFETAENILSDRWELPVWLSNIKYSPDGAQIAGVSLPNSTIYIIDIGTGECINTLKWENPVYSALYAAYISPNWQQIAWLSKNIIQLMDMETEELGPLLMHKDFINNFAWSPDGQMIATSAIDEINGELAPVIYIWNAIEGELVQEIVQKAIIQDIYFSSTGSEIAIYDSDGNLQIWKFP